MTTPHISTYWHAHYIDAARLAYPAITANHDLAVGWKITRADGTTHDGYYWPLVNGDHDLPVLHECDAWDARNSRSCPEWPGDGLCLVTTHAGPASSGGLTLTSSIGHVLVYAPKSARSDEAGKCRAPWVVDVDCFDPVALIRAGLSWANLSWANLSGANLSRANLSRANLSGADLSWADLSWADLSWANLSRAKHDGYTVWPAGFNVAGRTK